MQLAQFVCSLAVRRSLCVWAARLHRDCDCRRRVRLLRLFGHRGLSNIPRLSWSQALAVKCGQLSREPPRHALSLFQNKHVRCLAVDAACMLTCCFAMRWVFPFRCASLLSVGVASPRWCTARSRSLPLAWATSRFGSSPRRSSWSACTPRPDGNPSKLCGHGSRESSQSCAEISNQSDQREQKRQRQHENESASSTPSATYSKRAPAQQPDSFFVQQSQLYASNANIKTNKHLRALQLLRAARDRSKVLKSSEDDRS